MKHIIQKSKNSNFDLIVYGILAIYFLLDYFSFFIKSNNILISLLFGMIGCLSFESYVSDKETFSINKFVMIYLFIFGYLAPAKQYISHSNLWNLTSFSEFDYIYSGFLVLLFEVLYVIGVKYLYKKPKIYRFTVGAKKGKVIIIKKMDYVVFIIFDLLSLLYLYKNNILFSFSGTWSSDNFGTIMTFILVIIRFLPVATFIFYMSVRNLFGVSPCSLEKLYLVLSLIVIGAIYFPLNGILPRYFLFGVYLMLVYVFFEDSPHKSLLMIGMMFGFVFLFPAFNYFKYHGIDDLSTFALGGLNFNFYDYDAHQIFMTTIHYVDDNGILFGRNLLTALLCFIPRSIWNGKLDPSGTLVSMYYHAPFTNLSCPIYAEFYLAFGLLGVLALTLMLAYFTRIYELSKYYRNCFNYGVSVIFMGMMIYILRGALLPATAYVLGMVVSFCLVYSFHFILSKCVIRRSNL